MSSQVKLSLDQNLLFTAIWLDFSYFLANLR